MSILKTYEFPKEVLEEARQLVTYADELSVIKYRGESFILKPRVVIIGRKPKLAVPTKFLRGGRWLLQPKCKLTKRERILKSLVKRYGEYNSWVGCDLHSGNVGEWKGRYVVFDW